LCYGKSTSAENGGKNMTARKVERPSKDILQEEIKNNSFLALGRKYGVSDNSIRKWCKWYGIPIK